MISVRNLSLQFSSPQGKSKVIFDISIDLRDGEYVALMGANGSGKTSLARCMNGILQPYEGEVLVDDLNTARPDDIEEIRRRVGLVFQQPENQIVAPTVEREIAFGLENLGLAQSEMHRRVEQALRRFELNEFRNKSPDQLSGGEKQRLALAAVMVMRPRHVIFDEPTSLLDHPSRVRFFNMLEELRNQRVTGADPLTFLLITQYPEEALFAERLLILDGGRLIMDGPPLEIFQRESELSACGLSVPAEVEAFLQYGKNGEGGLGIEHFLLSPIL